MIEINLVPDVKQELIHAQRIRSAVVTVSILIGLVSIAIVAILVFYIFAIQAARGAILDGQITSGNNKLLENSDFFFKVQQVEVNNPKPKFANQPF